MFRKSNHDAIRELESRGSRRLRVAQASLNTATLDAGAKRKRSDPHRSIEANKLDGERSGWNQADQMRQCAKDKQS
jgi:hypothetical protein